MNFEPLHISQQELENIERYLRDDMNDAERVAFEEQMRDDEKFQKTVEYYADLIDGLKTVSLKLSLDAFHAEMNEAETSIEQSQSMGTDKRHPVIKYLIAASLLLVVGLATWFIAFNQSSQSQLFAAYFEPDPGLITPMSSTDQYDFYSGMVDYKRENYRQAISKWEPLLGEKPRSDTLNYFLGVAYLAAGDEHAAVPHLKISVEANGSTFASEAYFYLGLAYLKAGNRDAAIQALAESEDERATDLRAELSENK